MRRSAFTLIEMLVIIIIVAVMASIVVPSYFGFWRKAQFDSVVGDVQSLFAFARQQAISKDTTVTLSFNPSTETFQVQIAAVPALSTDQPVALQSSDLAAQQNSSNIGSQEAIVLGQDCMVQGYHIGGSTSPSGNVGNSTSGSTQNGTDIHFRGDGTCEGVDFQLVSSSGNMAHMVMLPASGRLTREDQ